MEKDNIKKYLEKLELEVSKVEKIDNEETLSSDVYKLTLKDNTCLILKIMFNEKRLKRESFFLKKVKGHILVPNIISIIRPNGKYKGAILMECLSGKIAAAYDLSDDLSFNMGMLLAKLHKIPCDFYGDITDEKFLSPTLQSGVFILKTYFNKSFKECENHLDMSLLKKIEKFFYKKINEIKYLDGPCITHRDFKPGNIIIENDQIRGLIDWEIARNNFAEEDFSQMEYLVWDKYPDKKKAFLEGYRSIRKVPDIDFIMPVLRICKSLGTIGFTIERNTWDNKHKNIFETNLNYLQKFF